MDNIVEGDRGVKDLWKLMNISNDRFIRTTDDYHVETRPEDFQEDVRQGRHLQGHLQGQILHPLRVLLDREPAGGRQVPRLRPGGAGRRGGGLLLPPEQVRRPGPGSAGEHRLPPAPQPRPRDGEELPGPRPGGSVRLPHQLLLGHSGGLRSQARSLCVGGRPQQLYHRPGL